VSGSARSPTSRAPQLAALLAAAETGLLAFDAFPAEPWPELGSTDPLERVNREIGRRAAVWGAPQRRCPAAAGRDAGVEPTDEWLIGRRERSATSVAWSWPPTPWSVRPPSNHQQVAQLTAS
jgi:putative transposase